MKNGLWSYIKAAFNARPLGMPIPPNWIGIAAFGLLGLMSWGFWVLGAGLELAYLYTLAHSARFRGFVDGQTPAGAAGASQDRAQEILARLDPAHRARYGRLEGRCEALLSAQPAHAAGLEMQHDGLNDLLWLYLRLLRARQAMQALFDEAGQARPARLASRLQELERRRAAATNEALQQSIASQIDLLARRAANHAEAQQKLQYLDAELERIEQQVELLREQNVLAEGGRPVGQRIDVASASLNETSQWVREQEELYGDVDDLVDEAPPLLRISSR
jgi:hypothetical protein